jgi:hypothetical protein
LVHFIAIWYLLLPFGNVVVIWYIILPFGIFYCNSVNFLIIWYIFPRFGKYYKETSGNPAFGCDKKKALEKENGWKWHLQKLIKW